jgi:hypothetical protein
LFDDDDDTRSHFFIFSVSTTMAMTTPFLRILCLHDDNSNALELKDSLTQLGDRLYEHHGMDLVFVNSPLVVVDALIDPPKRLWWYEQNDDDDNKGSDHPSRIYRKDPDVFASDSDQENDLISEAESNTTDDHHHLSARGGRQSRYIGLDASLLLLQQVWASTPFTGILAIGQGVAVASILSLLPTTMPPPRFCIFINGFSLLPEQERLQDAIHCLHIFGDESNNGESVELNPARKLALQFGGTVHERQRHATDGPSFFTASDMNAVGRFLVRQKQSLLDLNTTGGEIVALQTALHLAEVEAADVIAEEIAANPPAALMAIIRPAGEVAGWSGNKRRQPNEEGGGAPCPSEFLLNRDKRKGQGASRQHPNQQTDDEDHVNSMSEKK